MRRLAKRSFQDRIVVASLSHDQDRNRRLYSNRRTTFAVILEASECLGLMSETHSSGTITEGTIKIGDVSDDSQFEPAFALARPAGIAAHAGGNFAMTV